MKLTKTHLLSLLSTAVLMIGAGSRWGGGTAAKAQDNVKGSTEPVVSSIDPAKLTYEYLVDSSLAQDDPANKKFKTVQAAYAAAPEGTEAKPTVIGIKPDVYQVNGSLERGASLSITKNWITFLGLTNDRRTVVIADNRGLDEGASDDGYLLDINATGFCMKNLTVINYCNCDYEYPGNPSKNLKMRNPTVTQAVAIQTSGDKHVYENVAFLSRLDTAFFRTNRSYNKNVYIEGTDDWMGGGTTAVWEDSTLVYPTGRGVMSASGCFFFNCKFEAARGLQFYKAEYGAAARPDAFINCIFPVSTPQAPIAWVRGIAVPRNNQYTPTYKNKDTSGNPAVIYNDSVNGPSSGYSREMSDEEAKAFNAWNLLRGNDGWDPAGVKEKYQGQTGVYRMALTTGGGGRGGRRGGAGAAAGGGAGGGLNPAAAAVYSTIRTGDAGVTINASLTPSDTPDSSITWSTQSNLVSLSSTTGPQILVTGQNKTEKAEYVPINAKASNGYYVTAYVYVEPKFIDPPAVTAAPKINPPAAGKASVDYTLDLGGREDQSLITWFTCDDASGANPVKVAVSRGNQPLKAYTLMPGDAGKYLRVSVEPKHPVCEAGPAVFAMASSPITPSDIPSSAVAANFRNFVEAITGPVPGRFSVLGGWSIVPGDKYADGFGIRGGGAGGARGGGGGVGVGAAGGAAGGARGGPGPGASALFYFKSGDAGDMQIDLVMTPDKTEGTIFAVPGSPDDTGGRNSHGDVFIKYDPVTKNGYSLRYWRTTDSNVACKYQFYKIENGAGSPLEGAPVQSGFFKQDTILTVKVVGTKISATGHNTVDSQTLNIEGTITPNKFAAAGVSSTGAQTIYSVMKVSYP